MGFAEVREARVSHSDNIRMLHPDALSTTLWKNHSFDPHGFAAVFLIQITLQPHITAPS